MARSRRQEGAVMLVVMLILMVATATAALSVHATQYELQAAGHARQAMQTRYISESVAMNTVAWFDKVFDPNLGGGFSQFYQNCASTTGAGAAMHKFGQPDRPGTAAYDTCRLSRRNIEPIDPRAAHERYAVRAATSPTAPTPAAGEPPLDPIGSVGPRQAYQPEEDFISDVTCRVTEIDKPGGSRARQYRCNVTARGRMLRPSPPQTKDWVIGTPGPGAVTYQQNPFSTYHESRMVILTEEEIVPGS